MGPTVSILIAHYQTPELTDLCLSLLRQKTRPRRYEVLAVDNGSDDGSIGRLARHRWVRWSRREPIAGELPCQAHGRAMNQAMEQAQSDLLVLIHTDTMILRGDWLEFLLANLEEAGPDCGVVGSWKMESQPAWKRVLKGGEDVVRRWLGRSTGRRSYVRTHCAMYRRSAVAAHPERFEPSPDRSVGEELHHSIVASGLGVRFLTPERLGRFVHHLNHATMALNPMMGAEDRYMARTRARAIRRIEKFMAEARRPEPLEAPKLTGSAWAPIR
jgi:cellulose synthase/poly-beta-1,6-N-acetylglucosamine synthase-like glycosyltransferase